MGRRDTDESIYIKIQGLTQVLEKRKATLDQMIQDKIKYQHMQGTKDDIYRLYREIAELRNELSTS
jgi:polyhydroxyalkanoate synthesis regulator phasin|tara:strand:+ start:1076 stop:1273 length:198 start_codon:yes stop_codon:yes gene_type:complete